jgi:CheY-like chemotaxis protein
MHTSSAVFADPSQVCSAMRAAGVSIPIVAMTGNVDPASIEVFKRAGFTALLAKPFGEVCFVTTVGSGETICFEHTRD